MSKLIKIIIFETVILVVLVTVLFLPKQKDITSVCFDEKCFTVEVADTAQEQQQGLMGRESLEKDRGMLFVFKEEGNYPFWMENTLIPLDIIWINKDKEVVFIADNIQPCKADPCPIVDPNQTAMYVLEINGGAAQKTNLKIGSKAVFLK